MTDGLVDSNDACPDNWGLPENDGCPPVGTVSVNVNLRSGPGTGYPTVGTVTPGGEFSILGRNQVGDWFRIRTNPTDDNETVEAWIFADLVTTDLATIDLLPVIEE